MSQTHDQMSTLTLKLNSKTHDQMSTLNSTPTRLNQTEPCRTRAARVSQLYDYSTVSKRVVTTSGLIPASLAS